MVVDVARWLADLPRADEEITPQLVFEGWLIQGTAPFIRIISGGLCLKFATGDVIGIEVLDTASEERARRARVIVRRGAPLLDACPGERMLGHLPAGRRPFALSSRPLFPGTISRTRFRELEEDFIRRNRLGRIGKT
jgi:hypothetical protein